MMSLVRAPFLLLIVCLSNTASLSAQTSTLKKPLAVPVLPTAETADLPIKVEPVPRRLIRNPELYSASVELLSQDESARHAAYARALLQVLKQLTGQTNAGSHPVVRGALADASKWVNTSQQSSLPSDSEGNTLVGGDPVFKANLRVSFDPQAVDSLIAAAGYHYWTGERPKPILWLSIDDGRGPRLVTAKQLNVIKSLADRGVQRGMRFLVPQGSAQELAALPLVVRLDGKALMPLNARYQNNTLLLGNIYRSVSGWSAWWSLWQDGVELGRWPMTDADARKVIASGADYASDFFAKRDSSPLDAGRSGAVMMEVVSITSLDDYVRVMTFLQTHASIRSVVVLMATPDKLRLQVDLRSGVNAFRGLMRSSGVLQPLGTVAASNTENSDPPISELPSIERFALKTE
jgi:hypothetical protein